MIEILIATNSVTLALLILTLRANWLWRQASRKNDYTAQDVDDLARALYQMRPWQSNCDPDGTHTGKWRTLTWNEVRDKAEDADTYTEYAITALEAGYRR